MKASERPVFGLVATPRRCAALLATALLATASAADELVWVEVEACDGPQGTAAYYGRIEPAVLDDLLVGASATPSRRFLTLHDACWRDDDGDLEDLGDDLYASDLALRVADVYRVVALHRDPHQVDAEQPAGRPRAPAHAADHRDADVAQPKF